ncbi:hypothetical protein D3C80_954120 [compost metagenome]
MWLVLAAQLQQPACGPWMLVFTPQAGPALAGDFLLATVAALASQHIQQVEIVRCLALLLGNHRAEGFAGDAGLAELHQQTLDKGLVRGQGHAGVRGGEAFVLEQWPVMEQILKATGEPQGLHLCSRRPVFHQRGVKRVRLGRAFEEGLNLFRLFQSQ